MRGTFHLMMCLTTCLCFHAVYGQDSTDSVEILIRPYAGLRGHTAVFDNQMELQENASRIGAELGIKKGKTGFIAGVEIQVNMFRGSSSFNADGNLSGGFLNIQAEQTQQVFGNRLGYLGISLDKYGTLTIGKQWSVYRDITSYTDRFNVFGARASATFVGGTDGGENGTGRADQSIIYRNQIGPFRFGAQVQARGGNNSQFIDGFGLSTQLEIMQDFFIGMAFNRAFLSENIIGSGKILGLSGHPTYVSLGTKYTGKRLDLSITCVLQKNGDFTQGFYIDPQTGAQRPTVVFDAKGIEIFGRYKFNKLSILTGYNLYAPAIGHISSIFGQSPVHSGFRRDDFIVGISYQPLKFVQIYSEQRLSAGKTAIGAKEKSVFTLGMKIDVSKRFNKMFLL
ncbi:porin [Chitinophaga defluvii]|uniref:Porin n=1 Tax=Chitinophaga defluvii TaxID=3163343 RepID=A0ABV2T8U6_9BACT